MDAKQCFKCLETKPLDDFYRHKAMADGHFGKCKECTKADVRDNYSANRPHYLAYEKRRSKQPHRVLFAKKSLRQYRIAHPERYRARLAVSNALRDGLIQKAECCMAPDCFSTVMLQGHHTNYDDPLGVTWLCLSCHVAVHNEAKAA